MRPTTRRPPIIASGSLFSFSLALLVGCPEGPEDCGRNARRVVGIEFSGPTVLPVTSTGDVLGGYAVTMTIERAADTGVAISCFVVRDEDPIWKLFWAVDDVLAAGFFTFPAGVSSRTIEGHFALLKRGNEDNVCGAGNPASSDGCSGESEAEVYLQNVTADGPTSPETAIRKVRLP